MPKPRTPQWDDSVEKWEEWIVKCSEFKRLERNKANEMDIVLSVPFKFNDYKKHELTRFGKDGMDNAVKFGDDKKLHAIILNNWKFMAYLDLHGKKPRLKDLKAYSSIYKA